MKIDTFSISYVTYDFTFTIVLIRFANFEKNNCGVTFFKLILTSFFFHKKTLLKILPCRIDACK